MRFRLRTLLLVTTVICALCGWYAFLKRMAEFHRAEAGINQINPLISEHPSIVLDVFMDGQNAWNPLPGSRSYHRARARDFEHAALRPWLAFVHCKPGTIFGAPLEPAPIIKRLTPRDDGAHQGDY